MQFCCNLTPTSASIHFLATISMTSGFFKAIEALVARNIAKPRGCRSSSCDGLRIVMLEVGGQEMRFGCNSPGGNRGAHHGCSCSCDSCYCRRSHGFCNCCDWCTCYHNDSAVLLVVVVVAAAIAPIAVFSRTQLPQFLGDMCSHFCPVRLQIPEFPTYQYHVTRCKPGAKPNIGSPESATQSLSDFAWNGMATGEYLKIILTYLAWFWRFWLLLLPAVWRGFLPWTIIACNIWFWWK